jgi:hypothetical protein
MDGNGWNVVVLQYLDSHLCGSGGQNSDEIKFTLGIKHPALKEESQLAGLDYSSR